MLEHASRVGLGENEQVAYDASAEDSAESEHSTVVESETRWKGLFTEYDRYVEPTGAWFVRCSTRIEVIAGEEVETDRRTGRGAGLGYGSDVANTYLSHMTEDQTTQAILRFARGGSGATVVARTSALRDDLPVVGEGQVVETWNETATAIAREYRALGREFTTADVRDVVDVTPRQVRRVLAELAEAGYVCRVEEGGGRAITYERVDDPGAGEVDLPTRDEAVDTRTPAVNEYYTWNVRVRGGDSAPTPVEWSGGAEVIGAPPAPAAVDGVEPPS